MSKFFIDTANIEEIKNALAMGFQGVTTNPSLMAKEPKGDYVKHLKKIVELLDNQPLSVEVFTNDKKEMVKQARGIDDILEYKPLAIKIHVSFEGQDNLSVIKTLSDLKIPVNATACMTESQAVLASQAGAKYVSLFWGRIRDGGDDPYMIVRNSVQLINKKSEIIIGSIREVGDIINASLSDADIITIPPKFLPDMTQHPETDRVVKQFFDDFKNWTT